MNFFRPRYRRSQRRLCFESLETRQLFSAAQIRDENLLPGFNGVWTADSPPAANGNAQNGSTDDKLQSATRIQGYTSKPSYNLGEPIDFRIDSTSSYEVRIFRLGYYQGLGARYVARLYHPGGSSQLGNTTRDGTTGRAIDWNWQPTLTWTPTESPVGSGNFVYTSPLETQPHPLLSGVYYALLVRLDPDFPSDPTKNKYSSIPFVIRNDSENTAVVMQTADATWQAYNFWGGKNLFYSKESELQGFPDSTRATQVRYDRPYDIRPHVLFEEASTIRFLEKNGYDVSYTTHVDVDQRYNTGSGAAGNLLRHKTYIVGGHDEYWSGEHVKALEDARMNNVSLVFMSGNEGYWKTRWDNDYKLMVCYKETHNNGLSFVDPTEVWTGLFRDLRQGTQQIPLNPEFDLIQPENALTGTGFVVNFDGAIDPQTHLPTGIPYKTKVGSSD
jgi:hypothetical protein